MFAKIIETAFGPILVFKDNGDEGPEIVCLIENNGTTIKAKLGYDDAGKREDAWGKLDELAEGAAKALYAIKL